MAELHTDDREGQKEQEEGVGCHLLRVFHLPTFYKLTAKPSKSKP